MRLSGRLQLAPTPRVIKQLGMVERFAGEWSRIGKMGVFNADLQTEAAVFGAEAALALDSTSPPGLPALLITLSRESLLEPESTPPTPPHFSEEVPLNRHLDQFLAAFQGTSRLTLDDLLSLYAKTAAIEPARPGVLPLRKDVDHFRAPVKGGSDEILFPTVSPYLVEQRLVELLSWAETELQSGTYHPLIIAPLFHLLFLQIHPFPRANHRLSLALLWHLLNQHGFPFLRFQHLSPIFRERSKSYFAALKQAEKTAGTNWSTMNIWFEFFFDCLLEVTRSLRELGESLLDETRLSEVQRRIINVVRNRGTASREIIAQETGIHVSTVKYNLALLAERGHLQRDGGGRATHYRIG